MIEVHILGSTSRIATCLRQRLTRVFLRNERVAVGYLRGNGWDMEVDRKVLVILAWSGYPNDQCVESIDANRDILRKALEMAKIEKYDQILFTSSAGALYKENTVELQSEVDTIAWSTSYGEQKAMAEGVLRVCCSNNS